VPGRYGITDLSTLGPGGGFFSDVILVQKLQAR
jgi:hypothetical protein